jgi:rRNA N6-adenosine-methyltransferase METTL5
MDMTDMFTFIEATLNYDPRNTSGGTTQDDDGLPLDDGCVDVVLTNPPFGTKNNAGIDMAFLKAACRIGRKAVYSFHKSSTRDHVIKEIGKWGYGGEVKAEMKFDVGKIYKFHKKGNVQIEVDLIRVDLTGKI